MRKVVALVESEPELKELFRQMEQLANQFADRLAFLDRQARKALEDFTPQKKSLWNEIEAVCRSRGLMPEGKWHMEFERDIGILMACNCSNHQGPDLGKVLSGLLTGID